MFIAGGSSEIKYSWVFNGQRSFLQQDARRFISQRTGNLYVAKVESSDAGNYTCAVRNMMTNATVLSSPTPVVVRRDVMGEYEPKIEVQFPDTLHISKGSSVKLECFALGNPVPSISWRRADGNPLPGKIKINHSSGVLEIPYFRPEDAGVYECVAENSRGRNVARGQLLFQNVEHLHWVQTLKDAHMAIDANLQWECKASGKPRPAYRWLKNENTRHGPVFTQEPSDSIFPLSIDDKQVFINCNARGNPTPHYRWKMDGREINTESDPNFSLVEGNLLISDPRVMDHAGVYQCIATNTFGTVVSREAKVQFAFLQNFSMKSRNTVSVREGQAVVLLCGPPPHYGGTLLTLLHYLL
ncbi:contactin-3-like [Notothenia coriiceps]|uniref:Contactin-3-like n=1 Tax=Notothenia coriiceps TaxID=8208 RepID=A0A6I9N8F5_9TELE|nr:PREDICTED: contactin-3-like [Notothenia coriiceps]